MTKDWMPWEEYPDLTLDRLTAVADLLRRVRHETVGLHESEGGDNSWSLGCRIYARTCYAIFQATKQHPWIKVISGGPDVLKFVFAIGIVPIRFYHGEPSSPPSRYLEISYPELRQLQLSLPGMKRGKDEGENVLVRVAVETDSAGEATTISLAKVAEQGDVLARYTIAAIPAASVTPIDRTKKKGVELPPPSVRPIKEDQKKDRDGGD